jgi:hypothetical protein
MPKEITQTVYKFSELGERAKQFALETERATLDVDYSHVLQDADHIAGLMGIIIATDTNGEPKIRFSGFCSQGDGASYGGTYGYRKNSVYEVEGYAPKDDELKRIAKGLREAQKQAGYKIQYAISWYNGGYCHSNTMRFDLLSAPTMQVDIVEQLLKDFADWIYKQLEKCHDDESSEEVIADYFEANDVWFTVQGRVV